MNEKNSSTVAKEKTESSKILALLNIIKKTTISIEALENQINHGSFFIDFRNHKVCEATYDEASKAVKAALKETLKERYSELKAVNAELNKIKGIE